MNLRGTSRPFTGAAAMGGRMRTYGSRPASWLVLLLAIGAAAGGPARRPSADAAPTRRLVELTITAAPTRLTILPGLTTDVFAFNGRVPGPTLELREGDSVVVRFQNELPQPSTIHWHGLHLPFTSDGSPFHPVPP
ncbi:MAG TPA: multicopper oxidase domain-containing protein, partial [Gemmatimonadaceae bacterium]|nr:multicopper oxidase domain-containing protein [Gemmatimonadaceae bacterium]